MNSNIELVKKAGDTVKALGVTAGGLIGVFATLGFFFLLIWLSDKAPARFKRLFRGK